MKNIRRTALLIVIALTMTSLAQAQQRRQGGPPPYDPTKEVTVSGVITETQVIEAPGATRLVLVMTVEGKTVGVILGPVDWTQKQNFAFPVGATAQVVGQTGFRFNSGPAMSPRLVKIGSKTLTLRDGTGQALWEK